ncbi:MAG: hypothetical protein UY36_C0008G0002 [Parcubacteria group bacterium GW2011_GWA1_49_11]|nr:MAG: hypothetical protein UY36_C0008G0002 [Parcubacteria group bacterium GW2011_GWA1_49_11]
MGGYASAAYNRFGTGTAGNAAITTTNDLLISGDLEIDGQLFVDGAASNRFSGGLEVTKGVHATGSISTGGDIYVSGNQILTGTLASGLINGQTISSAANFTGTVTAATSFLAPTFDTATGVALNLGTATQTALTLGRVGATTALNSSDWVISTTGGLTGISGIANDGSYTQTGTSANTLTGQLALVSASGSGSFELTSAASKLGINAGNATDTMFEVGGTASISSTLTLGGGITSNYTASNSFSGSIELTKGFRFGNLTQTGSNINYFAGNVGIGTTGPLANLHVSEDNNADIWISDSGGATDEKNWAIQNSRAAGGFRLRAINDANTDGSNALVITRTGTTIGNVSIPSGNVGIGTTGPGRKLEVHGSGVSANAMDNLANTIAVYDDRAQAANVGGQIVFAGTYTDAGAQAALAGIRGVKLNGTTGNYSGQLEFFTRNNGDDDWTGDQRMVIDNTGNVGIGTTGPNELFSIGQAAGTSVLIALQQSATTEGLIGIAGSGGAITAGSEAGDLVFRTSTENILFTTNSGTATHMKIDTNGNVGIGTTNVDTKFEVVGAASISAASSAPILRLYFHDRY